MQNQLHEILHGFQSITLKDIECVKLMTRADTKYLCQLNQLDRLLKKAQSEFRVLENRGNRLLGYESLYLDTPEHRMYLDHHNGKLNRYKVRIREYLTSHELFLEIKKKDNQLNTEKKRIPISSDRNFLKPEYKDFISSNSPYDPEFLEPKLRSSFKRITLVNNDIFERVTIDIHPAWQSGQRIIELPNLVIIEVKSVITTSSAGFGSLLREERILPKRLSKYCTGTTLLFPVIKHNRFKAKLLHLKKLDKNLIYGE
ncbi:MAG: polyphosphate polymerase domain-containing protein [Porphyromonadaceae bacterium]|nr:MAG: polyphosphate polymerase domain-containing protein [Porphyromonadaceae bacterium]